MFSKNWSYFFIAVVVLCVFLGYITPSLALLLGILNGVLQTFNYELVKSSINLQKYLLQIAVIGLGFGIHIQDAFKIGAQGFSISLIAIVCTFLITFTISRLVGSEKKLTTLIASGTAICGGSAIVAVSPGIKANSQQTSMALAVVFVLNAIALFVFPPIGHFFDLSQTQFGLWCAIAIHDTSSVIGASQVFGAESLTIATTTKLVRALWIIPLVLILSFSHKSSGKVNFPWFILAFLFAMVFTSYIPGMEKVGNSIMWLAQKLLILTLFLIGLQINVLQLKKLGYKTAIMGTLTWMLLSTLSLFYILNYV